MLNLIILISEISILVMINLVSINVILEGLHMENFVSIGIILSFFVLLTNQYT